MAGGERPEAQVARHVAAGRSDLTSGTAQVLQRAGAAWPSRLGAAHACEPAHAPRPARPSARALTCRTRTRPHRAPRSAPACPYSPRSSAPSVPDRHVGPRPPARPVTGSPAGRGHGASSPPHWHQEGELHLWGARDPSHGSRAPGSPAAASSS